MRVQGTISKMITKHVPVSVILPSNSSTQEHVRGHVQMITSEASKCDPFLTPSDNRDCEGPCQNDDKEGKCDPVCQTQGYEST